MKTELSFYKGKTVLVTGHTGFKGTWMCKVLDMLGANVVGYAIEPPTDPSLFEITQMSNRITSIMGDIRDFEKIYSVIEEYKPEIVIHMAAQPIVLESYKDPLYTYQTNVMGTVNICEAIRRSECVKSFVNVTTDKVYLNNEWEWGYRETDYLDGYDPYSNSKSCSELVTSSYKKSFYGSKGIAVSTCRAGNVIGGGDFAKDRIIPDCVRAIESGNKIKVRNPYSIRPYQHVLEPVMLYLVIAAEQYFDPGLSNSYNIGPDDCDCISTGELVDLFCKLWGSGAEWEDISGKNEFHEANYLKLDCSRIKSALKWRAHWGIEEAVASVVEWTRGYLANRDINEIMENQIKDYLESYSKNK